MKISKILKTIVLGSMVAFAAFSCAKQENANEDFLHYVDPMIGSGGHGHVFVGANVPLGMVQAGPQNINKGWDWSSGYHYSDSILTGFSQTRLSGTGCADMGDVLIMPFEGKIRTERGEQNNIEGTCSSYYTHENENVAPGYYSLLADNGIFTEITATERVALYHMRYSESGEEPRLLINLKESVAGDCKESYLRKVDENTIEGYRHASGWSPSRKVFFVMKTVQPIQSFDVFDNHVAAGTDQVEGEGVQGVITFKDAPADINLKIAISPVSCENAMTNMEAELAGWDFDATREAAEEKWLKKLSEIKIATDDESAKTKFYTAVYHLYMAPTLYCDVDGRFRGHDDKIYEADWTNYSTLSLWDTYRTLNPLMTILHPEIVPDVVNSMLSIFDQQGRLPIWPLWGGETNCMPGYSALPIIADAYLKGIEGFDAERALNYMVASATNKNQKGIPDILEKGWIPFENVVDATSYAMEYAVGDWGLSHMAEKMGKKEIAATFAERGLGYRHYFDTTINFIRPLMADGSRRSPYDPCNVTGFCEGNGWQYTFFVPQYPEDLIQMMGGDKKFIEQLDKFFTIDASLQGNAPEDISGLIGMYAHGNEPSHHIAYMYAYAGEQWKSAERIKYIQDEMYTDEIDGIIGNEDCGQMSAWHVISALGFYQVNPSNGIFVFGTPSFPEAVINLPQNRTFKVFAENLSDENFYIQSVKLNGQPLSRTFITYDEIMAGGILEFTMGAEPNKEFGKAMEDRPKSL